MESNPNDFCVMSPEIQASIRLVAIPYSCGLPLPVRIVTFLGPQDLQLLVRRLAGNSRSQLKGHTRIETRHKEIVVAQLCNHRAPL